MKTKNIFNSLSLLCLMLISGCNNQTSSSISNVSSINSIASVTSSSNEVIYKAFVKSINDTVLKNVDVEIYNNGQLVNKVTTDFYGKIEVSLPKDTYKVKLSNLPKGMYFDEDVTLTENEEITLTCLAKPINENLPGNKFYLIGDIMYDFTITDSEGKKFNLAKTLEEKDGVIINFWSTSCEPCIEEFAFFEEAYQTYKENVEIFALSVESYDSIEDVQEFKETYELSFPMGRDIRRLLLWSFIRFFGDASTGSYSVPGTVFVDKYGFVHKTCSSSYISLNELKQDFEGLINKYK